MSPLILAFLIQAGTAPPSAADEPTKALHDAVVDAIRNCPHSTDGEIAVCARDRGFAQRYRIEKLTKPATIDEPKITLSGASAPGSTVPGTCTSASAAGAIGCSKRDYDDWAAWKRKKKQAEDAAP